MTTDPLLQLNSSVRPGERLLWHGVPDPAVLFTRHDFFLVPFTLVWTGFASTALVAAVRSGDQVFALFGIPFMLVGLYAVVGRFFVKRWVKRRTVYAVTNIRALVLTGSRALQDMPIATQPVEIRKSRDLSHVSVLIGPAGGRQDFSNTGLDVFGQGVTRFGMYDVADVQGLLGALDEVRGQQPTTA